MRLAHRDSGKRHVVDDGPDEHLVGLEDELGRGAPARASDALEHVDAAGASVCNSFSVLLKAKIGVERESKEDWMWVTLEFVFVVGEVKSVLVVISSFVEDDIFCFVDTYFGPPFG